MARRVKREFATVRQLPSKRWQVRYTGPDGVRHTAPRTFDYRSEALAFCEKMRREISREEWREDGRDQVTFAAFAQQWLDTRQVAGRPIKPRTREHYQSLLDDHLIEAFGPRQITTIQPKHVREWYSQTLADRPTLRSHAYSLLRTIMSSAVTDEFIDQNPCRISGAGRAKRVHKIRPASLDELQALVWEMPKQYRAMTLLASWCALRFGELTELRNHDLVLTIPPENDEAVPSGVVRVERAVVRTQGGYVVTTPKSEAGARDVAIPPHLVIYLDRHLEMFAPKAGDLLFTASHGGHLAPATLYRHFYKARTAAGRPDLRWHDLRHSGAVLAAATGATLAELMARLGHSTPTAAMRYQHAAQGRDREIASLLSKLAKNG